MTSYEKVSKNARKFLSLTGYTVREFQALLPYFAAAFLAYVAEYTLEGKPRRGRSYQSYANSPLATMEDKFLFILLYLKTNNLQAVQGELFGMHQSEANTWIHLLAPLVKAALAACGELPVRTMEELALEVEDATFFFHDGTERPINRPRDPEEQKRYYSGKKKAHTVKNDVIGDESARIVFLTDTVEGKKHDKKLADEAGYTLPPGATLAQDTGFQGFSIEGVAILQPTKKPRNGQLSDQQKATNRWISSIRIRIEHMIGGVKRYRIVKDKSRNWKHGFRDLVMELCSGLHNFRLRFRPWYRNHPLYNYFMIQSL